MPAKTQNINELLTIADNLYEAAMVIARRARQVNEEMYQKKRDHQILEELEGGFDDDFLHAENEDNDLAEVIESDENPIIHAQQEFLENKLQSRFESSHR